MERFKKTKVASILGILANIFLLVIKGIIGFLTKSQAMIADAANSLGDVFSSLITYIGNKIASKPSDDDHNLGHGKAEYIFSMLISFIMFVIGIIVLKDAVLSFFSKKHIVYSIWLIIVCIITITIKFILYIYTNSLAKKYNNLLIKANSKDHLNDCLITFCNLISCILSIMKIYWLDSLVGVLISSWMMLTALKIYKESYDVLMDKSISMETRDKVFEIIKGHKEIKKVNHFNSTPVGYRYQISFTIFVDGNLTTSESHKIADDLEKEIGKKLNEIYLTIIHVNPVDITKNK